MSIQGLLERSGVRATVTHHAAGAEDKYGDAVAETTGTDTYPALFEQTDSVELRIGRDTVISTWRVFLPAGAVVAHNDDVEAPNMPAFRVVGHPARHRAQNVERLVEARLQEITG